MPSGTFVKSGIICVLNEDWRNYIQLIEGNPKIKEIGEKGKVLLASLLTFTGMSRHREEMMELKCHLSGWSCGTMS